MHHFHRSLSPDNGETTGITEETLHCKRKRAPLMMETVRGNRESNETKIKQGWTDLRWLTWRTPVLSQSLFPR